MWIDELSLVLTLLCVARDVKSYVVLVNNNLAVEWRPDDVIRDSCRVYHKSRVAPDQEVTQVTTAVLHDNVQQCWKKHRDQQNTPLAFSLPWKRTTLPSVDMTITYPGTKWCGPGDRAKSFTDLGHFKRVDSCCRAHDHCPNHLLAGQSGYGLKNDALVTLTSCGCDDEFRQCLNNIDTANSVAVGTIFFDIVREKCFRINKEGKGTLEYPNAFSSAGNIVEHPKVILNKTKEALEEAKDAIEHTGESIIHKIKDIFH